MVFHWSLSDRQSLQVSRTLLMILADLNCAVVWMVFIHPHLPVSKSSEIVANVPMTCSIVFQNPSICNYFLSLWFSHFVLPEQTIIWQVIFFCQLSQDRVFGLGLGNLFVSQNPRDYYYYYYYCEFFSLVLAGDQDGADFPLISNSSSLFFHPFRDSS